MNKRKNALITATAAFLSLAVFTSATPAVKPSALDAKSLKIGIVSFKKCVEMSKLGKKEQAAFEEMRRQMETAIEEKEKELNEMASKFNDEYLDSLSPKAEEELKEQFRVLSQEVSQRQGQFYQLLNQTNMQIIQKINDQVTEAAEKIAKEKGLAFIFSDEAVFFYDPACDISKEVVAKLDAQFDTDAKAKPQDPKAETGT